MANKVEPVSLSGFPEKLDDTTKVKSFLGSSPQADVSAHIAWMLCDTLESKNSTSDDSEANHDQDRSAERAKRLAAIEQSLKICE